jgi:hypothetical protein
VPRLHVRSVRSWDEMLDALRTADEIILAGPTDFRKEVIKLVEVTGFPLKPGQLRPADARWSVEPSMFDPVVIKRRYGPLAN